MVCLKVGNSGYKMTGVVEWLDHMLITCWSHAGHKIHEVIQLHH